MKNFYCIACSVFCRFEPGWAMTVRALRTAINMYSLHKESLCDDVNNELMHELRHVAHYGNAVACHAPEQDLVVAC